MLPRLESLARRGGGGGGGIPPVPLGGRLALFCDFNDERDVFRARGGGTGDVIGVSVAEVASEPG